MKETEREQDSQAPYAAEDEIDLLELWGVIWKWRRFIRNFVVVVVLLTAAISLFMTNMYKAEAVIAPVAQSKEAGPSAAMSALYQQFGGLPGIINPAGTSAAEIVSLLKSNILREKLITSYNLLPVLFPDAWNPQTKRWRAEEEGWEFSLKYIDPRFWASQIAALFQPSPAGAVKKTPGVPDVWDGLRKLEDLINVKNNLKENTITISAQFPDPVMAARLVEYILTTLTDHMSAEARRVAQTNQKYLESQLASASDPFIKQKIYNLIAQQIETSMMAEVKENFAFKVLDPPKAPDRKSKPKRTLMVAIAFVVALFMGIFIAFFLEFLEKRGIDPMAFPGLGRVVSAYDRLRVRKGGSR